MAHQGIAPGRAYRAYRFPHRTGGRMSRRVSAVRPVGTFAGILSAVLLAGGGFVGFAVIATLGYFAADLPAAHDLATVPIPLTPHLYDRTGEHLLYTLADERRDLIAIDAVPKRMQDATISIEDKTFWSNPGVDVGGIVRAFQANSASGRITQGGSTITQQLIKTRLLGDDPTFTRKIKEAILALEATRTFSKKQILEMYFNQIYYGNQAYGLKAAAATYFGVADLSQLTLGQMALLAGLPQAPSEFDPIQNMAGAKARRALVLDAMVDNGYATESEAAVAKDEAIGVKPATTSLYAPHFTFRLREQLVQVLGEKAAYRGGYNVYSSLDWNMQQLAEKEVRDHVDGLKGNNVNNAALITLDPTTGEILAYVGSYDYYKHTPQVQGDYDHAGIAYRQPGSTFKLFTYLTGMLKAGMTPATQLFDIQFTMPDGAGKPYAPMDATKEQHGPLTMRQALRESLNLPALQVTRTVGVDAIIDTVHQLGINRDWDRSQIGLSFGIGAGEMRLTAIWMGNSDNSEMRGISSALGPGVLWRDYMKTVVGALPPDWYPRPDGIVDKTVCVNPSLMGGNGSGLLPGPNCPGTFKFTEHFVQGTEPTTDDRNFYTSCGIRLVAPFADWQGAYNAWASGAVSGRFSYGRFFWTICGFVPKPIESPSPSPGGPTGPPNATQPPFPTQPPRPTPTRKP